MAATSRKKKKKQLSIQLGKNDERIPKMIGLLCLFFAFYLFIAFTSYLFTWKEDQNHVLTHSWGLFAQSEIVVANWLGRLGAIISNMFFYWLFGIASYAFIFLLLLTGMALVKRTAFEKLLSPIRYTFGFLIFASIVLAFIFSDAAFPWGGAFGKGISEWLVSFVGSIGTVLLIIFVMAGFLMWSFNPNVNEWTIDGIILEFKDRFEHHILGKKKARFYNPRKKAVPKEKPEVLKVAEKKEIEPEIIPKGEQLQFEMEEKTALRKKPKAALDDELEIVSQPPKAELDDEPKPIPIEQGNDIDKLSIEQENKNHVEPYDPTLELSAYEHPVLQLLIEYDNSGMEIDRAELETNKDQIIETLLNYKIEIVKIKATIGPTVTLYEIVPAPGVRISKIKNLEDDIALSLAALGIRIIAPIPGKGTIGIEVPNKKKQTVGLKEILMSEKFKRAKMDLPIALGKNIANEVIVADLAKMPHLLIAGATGQGKSVGINTVIMSLLYKKHPSQVKLVLVDPKKVELFPYAKLENHFLAYLPGEDEPITTDTNKVVHTLNSLCIEMDQRYDLLKKAHSRNIREYNEKFTSRRLNPNNGHAFMPFIVLIIDEFADLIMTAGKEIELPIGRLAQLARAVGIHLIIATQRPSVNIITGVIKANFPARIAYKVSSKIDSRTILDTGGAEQLIGRGDMLVSVDGETIRVQCAFVDTPEVERVINFIGDQRGYPEPHFLPEFHGDDDGPQIGGVNVNDLDDLFDDAARLIVQNQHGSTSMLQRRLKLGYNRAGRIMDQLEAMGVVGPNEGSKAREVLVYDEIELERFLEDLRKKP